MWKRVSKLFKRNADDGAALESGQRAFEMGQAAAEEIAADIDLVSNAILGPRRERFLMVLDQRLTGIAPVEGVTFTEQARIELSVMWDNWSNRNDEQEAEIWNVMASRWNDVLPTLDPEGRLCREAIKAKVAEYSLGLFNEGVERTTEAVERQK